MEEVITEKQYPVQKVWILKPAIPFLPLPIIFAWLFFSFIFSFIGGKMNSQSNIEIVLKLGMILLGLILCLFLVLLFPELKRRNFHYFLEEKFLTCKQGILSKQERHIPYGVIQNVITKQDFFDRFFNIVTLVIENAAQSGGALAAMQSRRVLGLMIGTETKHQLGIIGFYGNAIHIPGLKKQSAEILKEIVLQKMKENPIDDNQSGL
jgi:membrane protein YdbS with pleckstrin-like domain